MVAVCCRCCSEAGAKCCCEAISKLARNKHSGAVRRRQTTVTVDADVGLKLVEPHPLVEHEAVPHQRV